MFLRVTWAAIVLGAFSFALWLGCLVTRIFTCTRSLFSDSWLIILFALRTYDIVSDFAFRFISLKKGGAFDYATTTDADTVRLVSLVRAILGAVLYIPSVVSLRAQASFYGPSSATAKWAFYVTMGIRLFEDLPQAGITGLYLLELGFTRSYIATISFGCTCLMVLCALTGCCRGKPSHNTESDKSAYRYNHNSSCHMLGGIACAKQMPTIMAVNKCMRASASRGALRNAS